MGGMGRLADQALAARELGHLGVTQCFGPDGPLAESGEAVVAATFIVEARVGAFVGFLNHSRFQEALDGAV
jgi:hypothetical protein